MDKLREHRKKYDPFWDIDPIELRCGLADSIDLIERISHYLKDESAEQPFSPFFQLTEQRPTMARFKIFDRGDNPDQLPIMGEIETIMTGNGSRVSLVPNFRNTHGENARRAAVVHGIYRVMLNVFSIHDVLRDPDLPDRFAHGFEDVLPPTGISTESVQRQLADAQESLRLIEERKAHYVQEVDIPLQLIKDERALKKQVAELRIKLSSQ
jgi:hypothetical protein